MLGHKLGPALALSRCDRIQDRYVFPAPVLHPPAIGVASEFQQSPQPVLLLDGLQEEDIAAEFGNHFMELRIRIEQLPRIDGGYVGMRLQIEMLKTASFQGGRIMAKGAEKQSGGLDRGAEIVAVT
jgi:hypothetical protein